uniref:Uncharacterized protein n=1 Tax=Anguilla anguilla TaxID=7936 RepID=A0A0E9XFH6_ANGAN
MYRVVSGQSLF